MIFKGIITSKISQPSKSTGKYYTTFGIGDKKFNCFDALLIKDFQEGDNVEIETKTSGKYENMVSMKKIAVEPSNPQINAPVVPSLLQQGNNRPTLKPIPQEFHQSIEAIRYEALDITLKYLALRGEKPTMDLVLNMANVYKEFLEGKIDMMVKE